MAAVRAGAADLHPRGRPLYFGPEARRLFGWYHPASASGLAVVLCNPFGAEAQMAHRSVRYFAEAFARAGLPSLRFDYDGTGDSVGYDGDPGRVDAWLSSIHAACDELRARSGATRVVLFGVRLGATLAATAAAERDDIAGLIAMAPVVSTGRYLRELAAAHSWTGLAPSPDGVHGLPQDGQEAAGFLLTAETMDALGVLDPLAQPYPPAPRVLVLDRPDRSTSEAWCTRLRELSAEVDLRRLPGIPEMFQDAHESVVPAEHVTAALAELRGMTLSKRICL